MKYNLINRKSGKIKRQHNFKHSIVRIDTMQVVR